MARVEGQRHEKILDEAQRVICEEWVNNEMRSNFVRSTRIYEKMNISEPKNVVGASLTDADFLEVDKQHNGRGNRFRICEDCINC